QPLQALLGAVVVGRRRLDVKVIGVQGQGVAVCPQRALPVSSGLGAQGLAVTHAGRGVARLGRGVLGVGQLVEQFGGVLEQAHLGQQVQLAQLGVQVDGVGVDDGVVVLERFVVKLQAFKGQRAVVVRDAAVGVALDGAGQVVKALAVTAQLAQQVAVVVVQAGVLGQALEAFLVPLFGAAQ